MRIGYPCINRSIGCSPSKTFRLASYTDDWLRTMVTGNLACLAKIIFYNASNGIFFSGLPLISYRVPHTWSAGLHGRNILQKNLSLLGLSSAKIIAKY